MLYQYSLFLIILAIGFSFGAPVILEDSVYKAGEIATVATGNAQYQFTVPSDKSYPVGIIVQPCFGTFDVYVDWDKVPSTGNYKFRQLWDSSLREVGTSYVSVAAGTVINVLIVPIRDYKDYPAASFNVIVSTDEANEITAKTPIPAANGDIQLEMQDEGKTGLVTYQKTDNPQDTYSIYKFTGTAPGGSFPFSSCGIQKYATVVENPQVTQLDNNTEQAKFTGLDRNIATSVTIMVTRTGGYSNVYNLGILNDPSSSSQLKSQSLSSMFAFVLLSIFIRFSLF
ncbi:hypothetical protein DLAC_05194 [Tieghemostelium lacteum]|uniref:Uncharacterized protein n=1 Tax=Tieghemostelium lacteum TaxID=361077 RepID=A0A151ZIS5_TIELA|nr:hypothetical protein DLAC_05194 [Tieghemostelium lacteum]|eukprot:KYQ93799.1 hypothetical protein DLAC_05194 [Tieghemostelium lacteum]